MTDTPTEAPAPEPTPIERVAQLAAEAATRALPDYGPRIEALERSVAEILQALQQAAGPTGNAAKLNARLDELDTGQGTLNKSLADTLRRGAELGQQLDALAAEQRAAALEPPKPHPGQQKLIDDLRLQVATLERTINAAR